MSSHRIFVDSGHWKNDSGAVYSGSLYESDIVMEIRDELKKLLPDVHYTKDYHVPDDLNLRNSIEWVNARCDPDDLAISIHTNNNSDQNIRGASAYYATDEQKSTAEVFAFTVSKELGIPFKGAIHDSKSYVGSLGWLRKLNCKSALVEICFPSNSEDRAILMEPDGRKLAAKGIYNAIMGIIPQPKPKKPVDELVALLRAIQRFIEVIIQRLLEGRF